MSKETLEEGYERIYDSLDYVGDFDFTSFKLGGKWQAEKMYSEEEAGELVYNIIGEYGKNYGILIGGAKLNELFEQFKK